MRFEHLSSKTLVITGASSGIGLATARMAAEAGANVFLISRNSAGLADICSALADQGCEAGFAVADVGDEAQLSAAADAAISQFGGLDAWINIAGVGVYSRLLDTPQNEHERTFRTNYWGVVNGARVAIPHLKASGGSFITVGSIASDLGSPMIGSYAASKHAVKGYIDSLRIELLAEKSGVAVTLIKPSSIGTPFPEHASNHMGVAAKLPPSVYAPELVAEAILIALQRRSREVTVGGTGLLQTLGFSHLPAVMDRILSKSIPLLQDKSRPPAIGNNLFEPASSGATRSRFQSSRPFSLFNTLVIHRKTAGIVGGLLIGLAGAALLARKKIRH